MCGQKGRYFLASNRPRPLHHAAGHDPDASSHSPASSGPCVAISDHHVAWHGPSSPILARCEDLGVFGKFPRPEPPDAVGQASFRDLDDVVSPPLVGSNDLIDVEILNASEQ